MKMLLAGDWESPFYQKACAIALNSLGVDVIKFAWGKYFQGLTGKAQEKFPFVGPATIRLNYDLIKNALSCTPDKIFIWRGVHILPQTLRFLKRKTGASLISYNNDDPFGPKVHWQAP
jgi:hypothetical protein